MATSEALDEARSLSERIAASLPKQVDAAALTRNSKVPFKVLSLRELLIHRVSALASAAVSQFEQDNHLAGVVLARAVLETVAMVFELHKQLAAWLDKRDDAALDSFAMNSLMANKWPEEKHQARSILTFVNHVEKTVPGFRHSYDGLSEYTHPNWSGVLGAFGEIDYERHILLLGGENGRTSAFKVGASALSGSLILFIHYYNDMVEMLGQLNEHYEAQAK